jgi:SHS family sialic acid transporter-like MFS transporter
VLVAAWGVWVNDALDFLAIAFVLGDIARRRGVRWIGGLAFGGLSY